MYTPAVMLLTTLALVNGGYLTGHHPLPSSLTSSTVISGGAIGGGPSNGAFSTSQFSQTVSSPALSTISTYSPINHGSYGSPRSNQAGYGSSNIPSVLAFGSYASGQGLGGVQGGGSGYGGQQTNGISRGQGYNSYTRF